MGMWLLVGAILIAAVGYTAWEFRWYWGTLVKTWRNDDGGSEREPDRELTGHKSH